MIDDNSKEFIKRHIGPSDDEQSKMLKHVGYSSLEDLMKNDSKYKSLKITGDVFFLLMAVILFGFKYSNNLRYIEKAFNVDEDTRTIIITIIFVIYLLIWASSVYMLHVKNRRVNNLTDEEVSDSVDTTQPNIINTHTHNYADIIGIPTV